MIRNTEIYVSSKTKRKLFWLRQLNESQGKLAVPIDEIADNLLNEAIDKQFPNMQTLMKRMDALEGQFIVELLSPTTET